MAFGVICNTLLVAVLGVPPATASARIHVVEIFTSGVSGLSHVFHRNIDWPLFFRLLVPGVIGGVLGAYVLSSLHAEVVKPFVLGYLVLIGIWLLIRSEEHTSELQSLMRISYAVFCLKKKKR